MHRNDDLRRRCDRFAALRQRLYVLILAIVALVTAVSDVGRDVVLWNRKQPEPQYVRPAPCPPDVLRTERMIEQLNTVERVC